MASSKKDNPNEEVLLMYVEEQESTKKRKKEEIILSIKQAAEEEIISDDYFAVVDQTQFPVYDKFIHGTSPAPFLITNSSLNYDELFSYLGKRTTRNLYDNHVGEESKNIMEKILAEVIPVTTKTIEKGIKKAKYFTPGDVTMSFQLPPEGMTSDEYEKLKLWNILNPALAKFYMDTL